jgi:hypothetical protein
MAAVAVGRPRDDDARNSLLYGAVCLCRFARLMSRNRHHRCPAALTDKRRDVFGLAGGLLLGGMLGWGIAVFLGHRPEELGRQLDFERDWSRLCCTQGVKAR